MDLCGLLVAPVRISVSPGSFGQRSGPFVIIGVAPAFAVSLDPVGAAFDTFHVGVGLRFLGTEAGADDRDQTKGAFAAAGTLLEAQKRGAIEKRTHWVGFEE